MRHRDSRLVDSEELRQANDTRASNRTGGPDRGLQCQRIRIRLAVVVVRGRQRSRLLRAEPDDLLTTTERDGIVLDHLRDIEPGPAVHHVAGVVIGERVQDVASVWKEST
ncbi:MAG: hypothetical protein H0W90_09475 [Actinobacteria bacterium]|nr:hypothetical protein [Actinomycetota bacterium]